MKGKRLLQVAAVLALLVSLGTGTGSATSAVDEAGREGAAGTTTPASISTAYTYRGELKGPGGPVKGTCDLLFVLWDAASGGSQVSYDLLHEGLAWVLVNPP